MTIRLNSHGRRRLLGRQTSAYLTLAAAVTALVHASRAESRVAAGDPAGAREASRKAKQWCWVTLGAGLILWAVVLTLVMFLADQASVR